MPKLVRKKGDISLKIKKFSFSLYYLFGSSFKKKIFLFGLIFEIAFY